MLGSLITSMRRYYANASGAAAVEYVVIAGAMTLALIPGFYYVSSALADKITFIISFVLGS